MSRSRTQTAFNGPTDELPQLLPRPDREDFQDGTGLRSTPIAGVQGPQMAASARPGRLVVKSGSRLIIVNVEDLRWVEAEGNYARLHVGSGSYLIRATMRSLEALLGDGRFTRIHRSTIARRDLITELRSTRDGNYDIVLRDGKQLKVGRAFREAVREWLLRGA